MHNDGVDSNQLHKYDIARKVLLELFVDHGIAAIFDDHGVTMKFLNIWERLG